MPRRFSRHLTAIPVLLRQPKNAFSVVHEQGTTLDVGIGGLSCQSQALMTTGEVVEVTLMLASRTFKTLGRVVWCVRSEQGFRAGIGFSDNVSIYHREWLEQLVFGNSGSGVPG